MGCDAVHLFHSVTLESGFLDYFLVGFGEDPFDYPGKQQASGDDLCDHDQGAESEENPHEDPAAVFLSMSRGKCGSGGDGSDYRSERFHGVLLFIFNAFALRYSIGRATSVDCYALLVQPSDIVCIL
jgi:hypothetical protein